MEVKGIDISTWQEGFKIINAINKGYSYVILRAGFTGTKDGINKNKDNQFENFYKQAKDLNFPVGAYWYSCANTYDKGVAEAEFMYENCLKGKQFEYPIYIDVEETEYQSSDYDGVTDAITGFCETLKNKGYFVGIYASLSRFGNWFDGNLPYTKWIACWSSNKPSTSLSYFDMWQNSSSNWIYDYRVDTDFAYRDFPKIIKDGGFNGFSKPTPTPDPKPEHENIKVGDWVYPIEMVDYYGTPVVAWDSKYKVTELVGDRAVLKAYRNDKLVTWCAMNVNNLKKV